MKVRALRYHVGDVEHCKVDTAFDSGLTDAYGYMLANFPENEPRFVMVEIPDRERDTMPAPREMQVTVDESDPRSPNDPRFGQCRHCGAAFPGHGGACSPCLEKMVAP